MTGTNHIGHKVKSIRKSMNLTQVEFAKLLSVSQGTISEIESFKTAPSSETIVAIQRINKKLCLNWLFQQDESSDSSQAFYPPQCDKVQGDFTEPIKKSGYYVTTILKGDSLIALAKLEQAAKDILASSHEAEPELELSTGLSQEHKQSSDSDANL